ncbi:hypothetical protein BBP40_007537 [Aspergillus hancockii]|nr:hypothetical protein BBP40_007537 [Aspergillus hancockii]
MPQTADAFLDPGYSAYGLGVYHQMHCLNYIRKAFYPEKLLREDPKEKIIAHKSRLCLYLLVKAVPMGYIKLTASDHCFDMIRQSILCHGDISLIYLWNKNYTYIDQDGQEKYTDEYLKMSPAERAVGTFAEWDVEVQCRDMASINAWVQEHRVDEQKYVDWKKAHLVA